MATQSGVQLPPGVPAPGGSGDMVLGGAGGGGFGPGMRGGPLGLLPPSILLGMVLAGSVLTAVGFWFIFKKLGYSGMFALLMAVPGVNVVVLFVLAFAEWPVLKELREQRAIAAMNAAEYASAHSTDTAGAPAVESTEPLAG